LPEIPADNTTEEETSNEDGVEPTDLEMAIMQQVKFT
jgi:hypothetical protein